MARHEARATMTPARPGAGEQVSAGHLVWLAVGALVGFSVAFLLGDLLTLPVDLYYLLYAASVAALVAVYVRRTRLEPPLWLSRRLAWGLVAGVAGGLVLMRGVLVGPATTQLSGAALWWALLWRGLVYGATDGVLLLAFPWVVVWRALRAESGGWRRRLGASVVAWAAILALTTAYHLGYRDFRSRKIAQPNIGSAIAAVPTLITANPLASVVSHVILHGTAVWHAPHTDLYLPPHRGSGEQSRSSLSIRGSSTRDGELPGSSGRPASSGGDEVGRGR